MRHVFSPLAKSAPSNARGSEWGWGPTENAERLKRLPAKNSPLAVGALALLGAALVHCGDGRRGNSLACDDDADCASGVCIEHLCVTPGAGDVSDVASTNVGNDGSETTTSESSEATTSGDTDAPQEVTVSGPPLTQISAGGSNACARRQDGAIWCWGFTTWDLAVGRDPKGAPKQIVGVGTDNRAVIMGDTFGCILKDDDTVSCWGMNDGGQLGRGRESASFDPYPPESVPGLAGVAALETQGRGAVALMTDGNVSYWGRGDGTWGVWSEGVTSPLHVLGLPAMRQAGPGIGVDRDGHVWMHDSETAGAPEQIPDVADGVQGVWMSGTFLFVRSDGTVWSRVGTAAATQVAGIGDAKRLVVADLTLCALTGAKEVWCWGANAFGQAGNGTRTPVATPTKVQGLPEIIDLAAANNYVVALSSTAELWWWGTAIQLFDPESWKIDETRPVRAKLP